MGFLNYYDVVNNNKSIISSTSDSSSYSSSSISIANHNIELSSKSIHHKSDSVKLLPPVMSSSASKEENILNNMNSDKVKNKSDIKDIINNDKNIERFEKLKNQLNKVEADDSKLLKEKVKTEDAVVKDENGSSENHLAKSIVEIKIPTLYSLKRALEILKPFWSCKEKNKEGKLIFVHIFKTAGSTMRSLFRLYSQYCVASSVTVVSCSGLNEQSIRDGKKKWKKSHGGPCIFKDGRTRFGEPILSESTYINTTYIQSNVDILGGHIPLGSLDTLNQHNNQNTTITSTPLLYFLFVRNAIQKFISGKMFSNRHNEDLTLEEIVIMIKKHVRNARKHNKYYQNYASYLITPYQRHLVLDRNSRTQLILNNLVNYKVIIGVVDRMSESLELLHHVIDSKQEMNNLFQHFGMGDSEGKRKDKIAFNKSKFYIINNK